MEQRKSVPGRGASKDRGHMVRLCGWRGWQGPDHVEGGMEDDHFILRAFSPVVCLPLPSPYPVGAFWYSGKNVDYGLPM